jgi:hypothetical protein
MGVTRAKNDLWSPLPRKHSYLIFQGWNFLWQLGTNRGACFIFLWKIVFPIPKVRENQNCEDTIKKRVFFHGANAKLVTPAKFRRNNIFKKKKHAPQFDWSIDQKVCARCIVSRRTKGGKLQIFVQISAFKKNAKQVAFFRFFKWISCFFSNI